MKLNITTIGTEVEGYTFIDANKMAMHKTLLPWEDNSVSELILNNVLTELDTDGVGFIRVIAEFYRICKHGAKIMISTPHPRNDEYINNPFNVRPIMPQTLNLFDKAAIASLVAENKYTPLHAFNLNVDLRLIATNLVLEPVFAELFNSKTINQEQLSVYIDTQNNVVKTIELTLSVFKFYEIAELTNASVDVWVKYIKAATETVE